MVILTTNRLIAKKQIIMIRCFVFIYFLRYYRRTHSIEWYAFQNSSPRWNESEMFRPHTGFCTRLGWSNSTANHYTYGNLTAGVTGKRGMWREKLPDAKSAVWGRDPESVGSARTCPVHAVLGCLFL